MLVDIGMAAACVLAATFAWAAAAKLSHPASTTAGFADLGLRRPAALARVVPAVELGLAVALLAAPRLGGVVALILLAVFSAVLVRVLRRGVEVRCACFDQTDGAPLSTLDLVRNAMLGTLAALSLGAGFQPRVPGAAGAGAVALGVAVAAGVLRMLRRRP
ncbi:MAG: MauE/DoxX family redox-associated membrane protein [Acidimicrobiales bacterium]